MAETVRRNGLVVRLVFLVLLAVLPAILLVIVHGLNDLDEAKGRGQGDALRLARRIAHAHEQLIASGKQLLITLAATPMVQQRDVAGCSRLLAQLLPQLGKEVTNILAITPEGDNFANGVAPPRTIDYTDRAWFKEALRTKELTLSGYIVGRSTGKPTMAMAYPALNPDGTVHTLTVSGINLDWVGNHLADENLPSNSIVTIVDKTGVVLAHMPPLPEIIGKDFSDLPIIREVLSRTEGSAEAKGIDGHKRLIGFTPMIQGLESSPVVYVGISTDEAYAKGRTALRNQVSLLLLVGLVGIVAALAIGMRCLVRPMRAMLVATRALGRGDLSVRVPPSFKVEEFNQLASSFNMMAGELEAHQIALVEKTKELARSNSELESFAYAASHDLQEPLRKVSSFAELLAKRYKGHLDETADRYIGFMVDGAQRMSHLINDLLSYSRINSKGGEFIPVDSGVVLDQVLGDLHASLAETGAEVSWKALPVVRADATQLGQVFQNLVANAIKFRGPEPPRVCVAANRNDQGWVFSVRDNGIGVEPQHFERIFRMFQRLHGRGEYPGTGIGLALCQRIVERHAGRIWVESEPGRGSTFYFTLPDREAPSA